jgi:hypothetical protein
MPEAAAATVTASSSAQGTPKAEEKPVIEKKPEAVPAAPPAEVKKEEVKAPVETPKADAVEAKPEEVKPVVYDIKLPKEAKISTQEVEQIKGYAKQNGLSNDQAQSIATFIDSQHNLVRAQAEGAWLDECKNHPVYGKENFPKSAENIKRYLERVAPKLIPILDKSGFANRVEVFEYLAEQAGKGQDDKIVQGKQTVMPDNRTPLQKLEDSLNAKYQKKP